MEIKKLKFTFKNEELSFIPVYYSKYMFNWLNDKEKVIKDVKKIESTKQFIKLSIERFGYSAFDYSLCKFERTSTPVMLKCLKCGEYFKVYPLQHLNGKIGCPVCSDLSKVVYNSVRLNYFHYYVKRRYRGFFGVPRNNDPEKIYIKCNGCGNIFRSTIEDIQDNLVCPRCDIDFREDILKPDILAKEERRKKLEQEIIDERERRLRQKSKDSEKVIEPFDYSVYKKEINKIRNSYSKIDKCKDSLESEIESVVFSPRPIFKIEYMNLRDKLKKISSSYKRSFRSIKELENYTYGSVDISEDKNKIERGIVYVDSYIKVIEDRLSYTF